MRTKKMSLYDVAKLGYYKFKKGKLNGVNGFFYWLENELTKEQEKQIREFKNVEFFISRPEYAPEIKKRVLFVGDRCLR